MKMKCLMNYQLQLKIIEKLLERKEKKNNVINQNIN